MACRVQRSRPGAGSAASRTPPVLIVVDGLVLAVFVPSDASVAVNVALPVVRGVIEKVFVPATSAALAGSVAFESELVIATVSVEVTGFQFASTALTVTVNALARGLGGRRAGLARRRAGCGGLSREQDLQLGERASVDRRRRARVGRLRAVGAVGRREGGASPAVFGVTANAFVPATSAALAGSAAFGSELVIAIVSVAVTRFQFASTALTVTLNDEPAVWALGAPVLPEAVPGAAVSPGRRIWSFAKAPALIVAAGLVLAVIAPLVTSVDVKVAVPPVFGVTENVLVPATSAALAGSAALASVEVMPTVSVEETGFQLASTALTVTLKAVPAVCAVGVPVLPEAVPGAAVSPGSRIWSFAKAPRVDGGGRAGVRGHRAVRLVGCRDRRGARGLERSPRTSSCRRRGRPVRAALRWRRSC